MRRLRTNNKIVNNSLWIIAERIMQMAVSVIINAVAARYFGTSSWGTINYCASFISIFTAFSTLGLEYVVIKEMIENPEEEGRIIGTSMVMRVISSISSIFCIQILVGVLKAGNTLFLWIAFLQSLQLIFKASELIDFWFQSKLQSKHVSIAKGITYVVVALWKIYILFTKKGEAWFAFSATLDALVTAVLLLYMYTRADGQKFLFSRTWVKRLLSQSKHFIIASMITVVYSEMDKIMLGNLMNESEVGIYTVAYGVAFMWVFIPNAIMNSYRPAIVEGYRTKTNYLERLKTLYSILIWIGIAAGLGIMVFGKLIIWILYGAEYMRAVPSLNLLIWSTLFSHLSVARSTWLVCEDLHRFSKVFPIWGVVINLALNAVLIPKIGATGASVATLVTQFVITMIAPLFYKETRISVKHMVDAFFARDLIDRIKGMRQ